MLPVVQHAIDWCEQHGRKYDAVCLLQPTTPLRRAAIIDRCVDILEREAADAVVTVRSIPSEYHPAWAYYADEQKWLRLCLGEKGPKPRRQDLPPAYHRDGSVYLTRWDVVRSGSLYGERTAMCLVDDEVWINVDTLDDWQRAEQLMRQRHE
jgi:CMP-N-acetylneuraminic acid synthetase